MLKASVLIPTVVCLASVLSPALVKAGEVFSKEGIAINGYDAVAYFTEGGPVKGSSAFSAPYKGAIFHFSTAANREVFLRDPARYVPQYRRWKALPELQRRYQSALEQGYQRLHPKGG
jgi:YHS domain-containing protein